MVAAFEDKSCGSLVKPLGERELDFKFLPAAGKSTFAAVTRSSRITLAGRGFCA